MASAPRAPKQWQLSKKETITSYESWSQNLIYILSLDKNFVPFLEATWQKKSSSNPHRGLTDDRAPIPEARRLSAVQKNAHLDLLLGQIANFCPVIHEALSSRILFPLMISGRKLANTMVSSLLDHTSSTWQLLSANLMSDQRIYINALWHSSKITCPLLVGVSPITERRWMLMKISAQPWKTP